MRCKVLSFLLIGASFSAFLAGCDSAPPADTPATTPGKVESPVKSPESTSKKATAKLDVQ